MDRCPREALRDDRVTALHRFDIGAVEMESSLERRQEPRERDVWAHALVIELGASSKA